MARIKREKQEASTNGGMTHVQGLMDRTQAGLNGEKDLAGGEANTEGKLPRPILSTVARENSENDREQPRNISPGVISLVSSLLFLHVWQLQSGV